MNRFKDYALLILFIVCAVESFILYCKEPNVVKSTTYLTKIESSTTILTLHTNASITGATTATTLPGGGVAVAGSNLSINTASSSVSTATSQSTAISKDIINYNWNAIYLGGVLTTDLSYGAEVNYSNKDVNISVTYLINRKEFIGHFGKSIVVW